MATKSGIAEERPATPARQAIKVKVFKAPNELDAEFGVDTQQEGHISGFVQTEHVRNLLDAFGLNDRKEVMFPFQHMKKQHGELWGMRIEPAAGHSVNGGTVMAHRWVYMQHQPETTGGAN